MLSVESSWYGKLLKTEEINSREECDSPKAEGQVC